MSFPESCPACYNPQPIVRNCLLCEVKTSYTCVGDDCWNIKPEPPGKTPIWICFTCRSRYCKKNQPPTPLPQEKYTIQLLFDDEGVNKKEKNYKRISGKYVDKKNYLTLEFHGYPRPNSDDKKTCPNCDNVQPVFRKCSVCECGNYFVCVGPDCWGTKPEAAGKFVCTPCQLGKRKKQKSKRRKRNDENRENENVTSSDSDDHFEFIDAHELLSSQNEKSLFELFNKEELDEARAVLRDTTNFEKKPEAGAAVVTVSEIPVKNEGMGIFETLRTIMGDRIQKVADDLNVDIFFNG